MIRLLFPILLVSCYLALPVTASESGEGNAEGSTHPANSLELIVAGTTSSGDIDPTLGLEYARYLHPRIAIGVGAETVFGAHHRDGLVFLFTKLGLTERWLVFFGPGAEYVNDKELELEWLFFARLGVAYEIPLPGHRFALEPQISLDAFPQEVKWVIGAGLVYRF